MNKDYAVIALGGVQHKVIEGNVIEVSRLQKEKEEKFDIKEILLVVKDSEVFLGTPYVDKAKVTIEVLEHFRGPKVTTIKFKAKSRYRRKMGFRQEMTRLVVRKISV